VELERYAVRLAGLLVEVECPDWVVALGGLEILLRCALRNQIAIFRDIGDKEVRRKLFVDLRPMT
jgi:hypothetical protein